MSKLQYRISNIRYRIRHRINFAISYVFVAGSCHFYIRTYIKSYDIVRYRTIYDTISYKKVRCRIRYATSRRYYTISYVHIVCLVAIIRYSASTSQKTYDVTVQCSIRFVYNVTIRCRMRFFYKYLDCCCWSHWPCPWSADRSCLMILGPPRWSVLHRDSPDALSLSLACATANMSRDSLVRAKMGISS